MASPSRWEGQTGPGLARRFRLPLAEVHRTLGSTNDRAKALAREGAPPFTLVVADHQTAGRGRGDRDWHSPAGCGVWASMILRSFGGETDARLPIRLGLSLAARLEEVSEGVVGLKWPNDLFLGHHGEHGKLGGILCERTVVPGPRRADRPGMGAVVVGIGLNVLPVQVEAEYPPAALSWVGQTDRGVVLECMVDAVRTAAEGAGEPLSMDELAVWAMRDILLGKTVQVLEQPPERQLGVARGIDHEGQLLVETRSGLSRVVAGRVRPLEASEGGASPLRSRH
jgi:BirA family biotin operon repressor/biotin-[acetyl-CoA-carboxylase] ligase